jgi:flagellar motor switch protein FliG
MRQKSFACGSSEAKRMVNMTDEPGLTGAEKVSILLLALGEDVAPLVLKKMTEQEIQRIK